MAEDRMLNDEILLGLIKANAGGGGGGTTNYNLLSNKPQIAGTELQGNKSLADLGIASAQSVENITNGESINNFAGVESALSGKQNALTAGDYIVIENDKISVSKLKQGKLDLYSYEFVTTDASHTPKVKVIKKVNGETISETVYDEFQAASWMTFDGIIRFRYDASDSYKWKYQCLVTSNEHVKDTVISWFWNQTVDYTETFDVGSSAITDLVTKGDMTDALATKQDTLTFDDTPTDGSNNPVKSNGIYDSEKDIYATMGEMGAKNLIPYPYDRESGYSSQGMTVTYDKNGVMTVNKVVGTGTAYFSLVSKTLNPNIKIDLKPNTKYILSLKLTNATDTSVAITKSTTGDIAAIRNKSTGYYENIFTTPSDMSVFTGIILYWDSTATESDAVVEVMIRLASDTDNTYQPYAKTNKQLTDDVALLDSGKTDTDMVAADFDAGTSYTAGNYCVQDGKLYKLKNNHSGAWSAADVDEVKITGELSALKSGLTDRAKVCFISVPSDKTDVSGFLGYILAKIITEQARGSYVVYGAWTNHDYYTGIVYKVANDTAIGMINYGASAQNMALYSACYKTDVYSDYKTVQYTT